MLRYRPPSASQPKSDAAASTAPRSLLVCVPNRSSCHSSPSGPPRILGHVQTQVNDCRDERSEPHVSALRLGGGLRNRGNRTCPIYALERSRTVPALTEPTGRLATAHLRDSSKCRRKSLTTSGETSITEI